MRKPRTGKKTKAPRASAAAPRRAARGPGGEIKQEILSAAIRRFARDGFAGTSLSDVAGEVGVSKQAVLYHYPSRETLRDAVVDRLMRLANENLVAWMSALTSNDSDRIPQAISQVGALFEAEPGAARVIMRFLLDDDPGVVDRIRAGAEPWFRVVQDALRHAQKDGRMRPELDLEAAVVQMGQLVLSNFAFLPIHGFTDSSPKEWRERRLKAAIKAIDHLLYPDAPAAAPQKERRKR